MSEVDEQPGPLAGVRVVELAAFIAGPFCGMVLGDLGAEVVKVERPPKGDPSRYRDGPESRGYSAGFAAVNRNKRSALFDLGAAPERAAVAELIASADVVVTSLRPSARRKLGFDYETVRRTNPGLVYLSITGVGEGEEAADRPAFDVTAQAQSGVLDVLGVAGDGHLQSKLYIADQLTGLYGAIGVLGALVERRATGVGREVRTSLLRSATAFTTINLYQYLNALAGSAAPRAPRAAGYLLAGSDGLGFAVHIPPSPPEIWDRFVAALDDGGLRDDARFASAKGRAENYEVLHELVRTVAKGRTRAEWLSRLERFDVAASPLNRLGDVPDDPMVVAEGLVVEYPGPDGEPVRAAASGVEVVGSGGYRRAPMPGEDSDAVRGGLAALAEESP